MLDFSVHWMLNIAYGGGGGGGADCLDYLVGQLINFVFRYWRVFRFVKLMILWIVDTNYAASTKGLLPSAFSRREIFFQENFQSILLMSTWCWGCFFMATVQWWTPSSDDVLASSLIVPQPLGIFSPRQGEHTHWVCSQWKCEEIPNYSVDDCQALKDDED